MGTDGTRNEGWFADEDQQQFTWPTDRTLIELTTQKHSDVLIATRTYEFWRGLNSVKYYHN
jgi:hypothetical protein